MNSVLSRRQFLAASVAAPAIFTAPSFASASKPNSNFGGVQIGTITYSYRSLPSSAEELLKYIVQCGISSVELMGGPVEQFAGAPGGKDKEALSKWRASAPMEKFTALRTMYNDAGVNIHIVKFGDIGNAKMPDSDIEYYCKVAKALGAKGITREISEDAAKRLGPIADKHKIMIAFHNHTQITPTTYDGPILSYGKYLGINLDIGHYLAGTNESPVPMIKKHHDRILSLHIKDRKRDNGPNMPFGEGDTPVAEILQLIKKEGWPIYADIELEYKVPAGSDAIKEITKCVQFCKKALA